MQAQKGMETKTLIIMIKMIKRTSDMDVESYRRVMEIYFKKFRQKAKQIHELNLSLAWS